VNWLVTGGTGFVGKRLVAALRARGEDVVVLSRGAASGAAGERVVAWTPAREGPWTDEVARADAVVHLAGAGVADERWSDARLREIRESRTGPTALVAKAIAASARPSRVLVSASAIGIYGMRKDDDVLAEDGAHGADVLASICEAWEAAADPARGAGVRVVHPRIGLVLGPEGGMLARMLPPFRAFVGGPIGDGAQWASWVHADDVVRAILFAVEHDALAGPVNVTAPHPVTMNELARTLGAALHRPSALRVPAAALRLAVGPGLAEAILTGQRVVPRALERAGFSFGFRELAPALKDLLRSR